jgi:hypothetical protein
MPEHIISPHVKDDDRQKEKRLKKKHTGPLSKRGSAGKAGRIEHKGGAGTSNKATGGKNAR